MDIEEMFGVEIFMFIGDRYLCFWIKEYEFGVCVELSEYLWVNVVGWLLIGVFMIIIGVVVVNFVVSFGGGVVVVGFGCIIIVLVFVLGFVCLVRKLFIEISVEGLKI